MPNPQTVLIPKPCTNSKCGRTMEIACRKMTGTFQTTFYAIDCPSCGQHHDIDLPGQPIDVRPTAQRVLNKIERS